MSQHFIHYLPRRIVIRIPHEPNSPWFADVQNMGDGFARPMYHTSRRKTGATRAVSPGDTIWILSQMFSPWGSLPPALDARIDVDQICDLKDGSRRFIAANTSTWFPLADISGLLTTLESKNIKGQSSKIRSNPNIPLGQYLQSMRLLSSSKYLQKWSENLIQQKAHFISYRICDGTFSAFIKAQELLNQGEIIFWDRWCLPRRLAERRELISDDALDEYLMKNLRQSKTVWGIQSRKYSADSSYSSKEMLEAKKLGIYRTVPLSNE